MSFDQQRDGVAHCNCGALRRAARRMTNFYDAKLAPTGLRITQFSMLAMVYEAGTLSVNEMAARLDLDRTTTGKNLRPLEREGLIQTTPCPTDRRSHEITLTDKGREALRAGTPLWREAQREFEAANGGDQAAALRQTLGGLSIPT
ncbi:MarR family winged helix-turn-helix transcriptional regulator [Nitrospirillum bahiense]|uniref:MarR family transcriptional regulator n=1 Tax=Nitrospirillum amazonense TaxID=28077 RepID=A0A560GDJ9_9PROT|nr:MarR family winged helix-turn-helix transcriptional regulator [Nitrospirillum amazonense]TWB31891.1 MarR family transcriptional regulator [Nitrospirillum amazonense]